MACAVFRNLTSVAALAGAACVLALLEARIYHGISLVEPLHVNTSGAEWESLFIVWRVIHGLDAYLDRLSIPFAASVYNWLFYYSYAWTVGGVLGIFGLDEAWLPTIGRLFSLAGALVTLLCCRRLFALTCEGRLGRGLEWAAAIFVALGPLPGFWVFTVRSDIWAMTFEVAATTAFAVLYPRHRHAACVALACLGVLAWSFKQVDVYSLGAGGLVLLWRRDWIGAATVAVLAGSAIAATITLGSPQYLKDILFVGFLVIRDWHRGFMNIVSFAMKSGPALLPLPVLAWAFWRDHAARKAFSADIVGPMALAGSLVSGSTAMASIFHSGSADNYFFTVTFFLMLLVLRGSALLARQSTSAPHAALIAQALGWVSMVAAMVPVMLGRVGSIDLYEQHRINSAGIACTATLPRPTYSDRMTLNLPWLTRDNTPFVLSFQYGAERLAGRVFEAGGVGGLISHGWFASLAFSEAVTVYDGAEVGLRYRLAPGRCPGYFVYVRDDLAAKE